MGFYSIYKIIKDMFRTVLGNKMLKKVIAILLIFICLTLYNKVFAYNPPLLSYNSETHYFNYNNNSFKLNDNIFTMPYILIFEDSRNMYLVNIVASTQPLLMSSMGTQNNYAIRSNTETTLYYNVFYYNNSTDVNNIKNYTLKNYYERTGSDINIQPFFLTQSTMLYSNYDVKNYDNPSQSIFASTLYQAPSLSNTQSQLENLSFNNFTINANSYTDELENNDGTLYMLFYNRSLSNSQNTDGLYPIQEKGFTKGSIYTDYENSTDSNMIFSYPIFKSGVFFNVGSTYEIRFAKKSYNSEYNTDFYEFFDNSYTFTISSNVTQDYINQINQQTATTSDKENQQNIENALNNQTQSIDNINNSITDSTVDNSSVNLPSDNTNDPTQNGIENIFQTIYNSFTSGTAQDIVFPIPNTNQNITLSANYIYNSLVNNDASWIIDIIRAFYWYIISRYIIVDINHKIRKIKQGNLEDIQDTNIKEEML